jgi:hypothetical protein
MNPRQMHILLAVFNWREGNEEYRKLFSLQYNSGRKLKQHFCSLSSGEEKKKFYFRKHADFRSKKEKGRKKTHSFLRVEKNLEKIDPPLLAKVKKKIADKKNLFVFDRRKKERKFSKVSRLSLSNRGREKTKIAMHTSFILFFDTKNYCTGHEEKGVHRTNYFSS